MGIFDTIFSKPNVNDKSGLNVYNEEGLIKFAYILAYMPKIYEKLKSGEFSEKIQVSPMEKLNAMVITGCPFSKL